MDCWICQKPITEIRLDDDLKILPCTECLEIVHETNQEFDEEFQIDHIESSITEYSEETNPEVGFGEWEIPEFMRKR